jgi:fructokinase
VGIGLVALDVILNGTPDTPPKVSAGGSCGNVLSILSFLGWQSHPIARLKNNLAAQKLVQDLRRWNVNTDMLFQNEDGSTPIIIHRILKNKLGDPAHRFEFKVPNTNTWLPNFKPVIRTETESIKKSVPKAKVFYFDRVSRSALDLAKYYAEGGALIFFEPSSMSDDRLFKEALEISHIVKYSHDRLPNYSNIFPNNQCFLEIETLGSSGLKFRTIKSRNKSWHTLKAPELSNYIDSAGAGDWCTAAIIHSLGSKGIKGLHKMKITHITNALQKGQILGALNCKFFGARGLMYGTSFRELSANFNRLANNKEITINGKLNYLPEANDFSFGSLI